MRRPFWTHLGTVSTLSLLALGLACALAGCGAGASSVNTSPTATDTPPPTPTATSAPTATATSPSSPNQGGCQTSQLALALVSSDGAAGHIRYLFKFTNISTSVCTFNGYPTVSGFDASVAIKDVAEAYTWPTVQIVPITLAPNSTAYFAIQADTATVNGNSCQSATPTIAPPQNSGGFTAPTNIMTCDGNLYVSPLVPVESDL